MGGNLYRGFESRPLRSTWGTVAFVPFVHGERELVVRGQEPADVLAWVRDGLIRRRRWIDARVTEGIAFRGGWGLAWRTSQKPIAGSVHAGSRDHDVVVRVAIRDAAVGAQIVMLGFERRQYESMINRELDAIQLDVERADDRSGAI